MDQPQYTTEYQERKKGQHLRPEDRGAIKAYKKAGYSNRAIARELRCSPTTIGNELKRGTPPRSSNRGKAPGYSPKRGEAVYRANRAACRKPHNKEGAYNIVFTSNRSPSLWRENFNEEDSLLCALDRIFDDATVFNIHGESFRGKRLETYALQAGKAAKKGI